MFKGPALVAACVCAMVSLFAATAADARSYYGNGSRPAGPSRACLAAEARALLNRIEARFGRVQLVSTCRRGARIRNTGKPSLHASGKAIDFNAPRGKKRELVRWLIANHRSGGVMTYAGMSHIHVDIGYRFVSLNFGARRKSRLA